THLPRGDTYRDPGALRDVRDLGSRGGGLVVRLARRELAVARHRIDGGGAAARGGRLWIQGGVRPDAFLAAAGPRRRAESRVGALGVAHPAPAVAILGFTGAVLHTVNHALFKGLLFLGAGAIYRATGTRNIDDLGGLARRMPLTWLGFLIGAAAIVGLPPLNGFVSEWLVFQDLFRAGQSGGGAGQTLRLAVFAAPVLALVGGLALACFAKAAGIV